MKKLIGIVAAGLSLAGHAVAHDFWLMPQQFQLQGPDRTNVSFMLGHGDEVEGWGLRWDRVVALRAHGGGTITDLHATLKLPDGAKPGYADVAFERPATYVVAFESHHSFSDLKADKFNSYAEKEGLRAVIEARAASRSTRKPGRELYSRRAKTIVQVGDQLTNNVLEPIGHTLEIVPERHPYALRADRILPVRIFFRGSPLPGATIDIAALGGNVEPFAQTVTDADGRARFEVPENGAYKLSVVWGVPNPQSKRAAFETIFGSLTIGYDKAE